MNDPYPGESWLTVSQPKVPATATASSGPETLGRAGSENRRARGSQSQHDLRKLFLGLLFIAPALTTLAAMFIYPLGYNLWLSFHSYNLAELYLGIRFVGLGNYSEILQDPYFWNAFRNSAIVTVSCLALELPIGMAIALALQRRVHGHSFFRFIFILPLLLIPAVTAYMWRFMFQYDGIVNYLLELAHIGAINWTTTTTGLMSVVITVVWQNAPFSFIIFLAGLQTIDPDIWAAAKVDGAGPIRGFIYVTLPLMRPFILVVLVIRSMDLLRLFDEGFVLTGGAPARETETLSQLIYTDTFTFFNIGRGSALAILEGAIVAAVVLLIYLAPGLRRSMR
jgi:multiple sugar transport system permease protein